MPTPPTEVSMVREHLERYRGVTLQTLDCTPADKLAWRAAADLRSVSDTFLHVAQVEDFYTRGLFANDWDFMRVAKPTRTHTHAELRDHLAATREFTLEHLALVDSASPKLASRCRKFRCRRRRLALVSRRARGPPQGAARRLPPPVRRDAAVLRDGLPEWNPSRHPRVSRRRARTRRTAARDPRSGRSTPGARVPEEPGSDPPDSKPNRKRTLRRESGGSVPGSVRVMAPYASSRVDDHPRGTGIRTRTGQRHRERELTGKNDPGSVCVS